MAAICIGACIGIMRGTAGTIACCIGIQGIGVGSIGMAAICIGACIGIHGIGAGAGMGIIGLAAMGVAML